MLQGLSIVDRKQKKLYKICTKVESMTIEIHQCHHNWVKMNSWPLKSWISIDEHPSTNILMLHINIQYVSYVIFSCLIYNLQYTYIQSPITNNKHTYTRTHAHTKLCIRMHALVLVYPMQFNHQYLVKNQIDFYSK